MAQTDAWQWSRDMNANKIWANLGLFPGCHWKRCQSTSFRSRAAKIIYANCSWLHTIDWLLTHPCRLYRLNQVNLDENVPQRNVLHILEYHYTLCNGWCCVKRDRWWWCHFDCDWEARSVLSDAILKMSILSHYIGVQCLEMLQFDARNVFLRLRFSIWRNHPPSSSRNTMSVWNVSF
jgi:hypothetical protein